MTRTEGEGVAAEKYECEKYKFHEKSAKLWIEGSVQVPVELKLRLLILNVTTNFFFYEFLGYLSWKFSTWTNRDPEVGIVERVQSCCCVIKWCGDSTILEVCNDAWPNALASNAIVALLSNEKGGEDRNRGKTVVKALLGEEKSQNLS